MVKTTYECREDVQTDKALAISTPSAFCLDRRADVVGQLFDDAFRLIPTTQLRHLNTDPHLTSPHPNPDRSVKPDPRPEP